MQWIKASERMPDNHKHILCKFGKNYLLAAFIDGYFVANDVHYAPQYIEWLDESPRLQEAAAISLLKEYGELEAEIIADNTLWWPYREDDALRGKIYDKMIELQGKRNEILAPPKPNNE